MKDVDNFEYIIKSGPTHIIKPKIIRLWPNIIKSYDSMRMIKIKNKRFYILNHISILNPFLLINKKDIIKVFK